jgi:hypothetical protein
MGDKYLDRLATLQAQKQEALKKESRHKSVKFFFQGRKYVKQVKDSTLSKIQSDFARSPPIYRLGALYGLLDLAAKEGKLIYALQIAEEIGKQKGVRSGDALKSKLLRAYDNIERLPEQDRSVNRVQGYKRLEEYLRANPTPERTPAQTGVAVVSIVGLLAGIFFLGSNLTGNAIANMSYNATNFTSVALFLVGIVAGIFYFQSRKKYF